MFDVTGVIADLSMQVKVGWTIWFAWSVALMGWYRHARVVAPVAPTAPPGRFMPGAVETTNDTWEEGQAYIDSTDPSAVAQ